MTEHDIRRAQAVTRWVEGVKERSQHRTRDGSVQNNRTDAEYVAEHIQVQADRLEELEGIVAKMRIERTNALDEMTRLDQELGLQ